MSLGDFFGGRGGGSSSSEGGVGVKATIQAIINIPVALNAINTLLKTLFPVATSTISHSATAGADTLPANPAGFLTVMVNGTAVKVPFYDV